MAADGDRASRREHVIAIVAIVASVVVGVSSSIVSCATSRDAQRTAREAQRETARAEREQADLAELRSVLDRAAADVDAMADAAVDIAAARGPGDQPPADEPTPARLRRLRHAARAARRSQVRLEIRIGRELRLKEHYNEAQHGYALALQADAVPWEELQAYMDAGAMSYTQFLAAARKLVGSQLPD